MQSSTRRSSVATVALLTLSAGLTACGGGGGSGSALAPASVQRSAAAQHSLGLVAADPRVVADMMHIRHAMSVVALPSKIDLSAKMPAVGDQGQEGSCVAWASAYAMRGYEARQDVWSSIAPKSTSPALNFSPAFVYNQINGGRDAGSAIPTALTLMKQTGAATLADMPYIAGAYTTQPSAAALGNAKNYKLSSYGYIAPTDLNSMKVQLAGGLPVILAIKVYYNFFLLGQNQVYSTISGAYQGGHAITIVGYDDAKQAVQIINSWGPYWGTGGYGWISYTALSQIALEAYSAIDDHGAPVATPTPNPSPTPTPVPTVKPSPSAAPTLKPAPSPAPSIKPSPSPSATPHH